MHDLTASYSNIHDVSHIDLLEYDSVFASLPSEIFEQLSPAAYAHGSSVITAPFIGAIVKIETDVCSSRTDLSKTLAAWLTIQNQSEADISVPMKRNLNQMSLVYAGNQYGLIQSPAIGAGVSGIMKCFKKLRSISCMIFA